MNCLDQGHVIITNHETDPARDEGKHRLFVLTDMGGDNDDNQSMVRLVLYANETGQEFHLNANGSYDPDHDSISYYWFQYVEAGDLPDPVSLVPFSQVLADLPVTAPAVTSPKTLHFILRVTDKGTPPLSRYRRVIVLVIP